jgi:hypothetical protein
MDIIQNVQTTVKTQCQINRRDAKSNPPSRWQVQTAVEVPKHSYNPEMQSQLHRLNRRPTIGASDGCRINRRLGIGASFGARRDQVKTAFRHRFNRLVRDRHRRIQHTIVQRRCQVRSSQAFSTRRTDAPSEQASEQSRHQEMIKNNGYVKILCHRFNRWPSIGLTDGPRDCCGYVREANGYFRAQCDRKNRCPSTEISDAYAEKCPTATNGYFEFVGYIYGFPRAIWSLLEFQDTTHTPKNTSKPSKSLMIKSLVLSTSFVSVSASLAPKWVREQGVVALYFGYRVNHTCISVCRLLGALVTHWHVNDSPAWCGAALTTLCGGRRPLLRGQAPSVESGIKVTVIMFTKETWLPGSDTLRECFNNVDVGAPLWQSKSRDKSSCREFAFSHPSSLSFRISYCKLCAFTFLV